MTAADTFQFKSEARQLLDIVIHSLYSNKEIFLRELISNSSDAIDKRRFEALTDAGLAPSEDYAVEIQADPEARTLRVSDNGVGMSRQECIDNLGTIARSGTRHFIEAMEKAEDKASMEALIGQFGVGFYASFMVADEVEVVTRRAGEEGATVWRSVGDGEFSVEDGERATVGTTVALKLKPVDTDDGLTDFTDEWIVRGVVKKYSDFVTTPIKLWVEREEPVAGDDAASKDDDAPPKTEKVTRWETVNSMKAIWTRPQEEVTEEEYAEFYKHVSKDWNAPLKAVTLKAEGTFEYHALLFIPSEAPWDLFHYDKEWGLQLYVNRVLIKERTDELLPRYLRFVKGVVESPDLSLNVSRELLQQDRRLGLIKKRVIRKVLDELAALREDKPEDYLKMWKAFGRALKEGLGEDRDNADKLKPLLLFASTHDSEKLTSLPEYMERMKDGQDAIYYIAGDSREALEASPHLETFRDRGVEVLLMADPIDEIVVDYMADFEGKKLQSVGKGQVELGDEDEREKVKEELEEKSKDLKPLFDAVRVALQDHVKEVRLSTRLKDSPACLVGDEGDMSANMARLLKQAGQEIPSQKRILELNAEHALIGKLQEMYTADAADARIGDYAHLLFGQALLAEGSPLPDPAGFGKRLIELMAG